MGSERICGINDAGRGVKPADYEADVTAIAEQMKAASVKLMLLTTTNLRAADGPTVARLREFNAILHRIAAKYGLTVAEVYDRMEDGRKKEPTLWEADGCHLNFAGYRWMTRAAKEPFFSAEWGVCGEQEDGSERGCAASAAMRWSNLGFRIGSKTESCIAAGGRISWNSHSMYAIARQYLHFHISHR